MVDEPPDPANQPTASAGEAPKKNDVVEVEVLPKSKEGPGHGAKAAAGGFLEMMSVQSGAAALASTFAKLPEAVQKQSLENEAARDRLSFDLEAKQLAAQASDRESERKDRLVRFEKTLDRDSDNDRRVFWFAVGILAATAIGTGLLCWAEQWAIAGHLVNTVAAGGLGYQGGKSAGFIKAGKQKQLTGGQDEPPA